MFYEAAIFMDDDDSGLRYSASAGGYDEVAKEVAGFAGIGDITGLNVRVVFGDADAWRHERGLGIELFIGTKRGQRGRHAACQLEHAINQFAAAKGTIDIEVNEFTYGGIIELHVCCGC